ncbi:hypothetical protein V8C37DRAFT_372117 [Trichoderma ceciliae]
MAIVALFSTLLSFIYKYIYNIASVLFVLVLLVFVFQFLALRAVGDTCTYLIVGGTLRPECVEASRTSASPSEALLRTLPSHLPQHCRLSLTCRPSPPSITAVHPVVAAN